jgi:hypothetical protein
MERDPDSATRIAVRDGNQRIGLLSIEVDGSWNVSELASALRKLDMIHLRFGAALYLQTSEGRAFARDRFGSLPWDVSSVPTAACVTLDPFVKLRV